jgi:hypothetical protein
LRVYGTAHAHSSLDKGVLLLGLGHDALRKIPADAEFRMRPDALAAAIAEDRHAGLLPFAVVATAGTTSTTSVDPVPAIADICERERLWLHVDAAYGGVAAIVPGHEWVLAGCDRADSLVVNPHKWLFTPLTQRSTAATWTQARVLSRAQHCAMAPVRREEPVDTGVQLSPVRSLNFVDDPAPLRRGHPGARIAGSFAARANWRRGGRDPTSSGCARADERWSASRKARGGRDGRGGVRPCARLLTPSRHWRNVYLAHEARCSSRFASPSQHPHD